MQENKMRHRHEELRLQREKMTAHMVWKSQTRFNVERIYDPQLQLLFGHLSERNGWSSKFWYKCSIIFQELTCGEHSCRSSFKAASRHFSSHLFLPFFSPNRTSVWKKWRNTKKKCECFTRPTMQLSPRTKYASMKSNNSLLLHAHFINAQKILTSVFPKGCWTGLQCRFFWVTKHDGHAHS